jgi:predicted cupin superfamily sugar epimerase
MTHSPGSVWHRVAVEHNWRILQYTPIPDAIIKAAFEQEAKKLGLR